MILTLLKLTTMFAIIAFATLIVTTIISLL